MSFPSQYERTVLHSHQTAARDLRCWDPPSTKAHYTSTENKSNAHLSSDYHPTEGYHHHQGSSREDTGNSDESFHTALTDPESSVKETHQGSGPMAPPAGYSQREIVPDEFVLGHAPKKTAKRAMSPSWKNVEPKRSRYDYSSQVGPEHVSHGGNPRAIPDEREIVTISDDDDGYTQRARHAGLMAAPSRVDTKSRARRSAQISQQPLSQSVPRASSFSGNALALHNSGAPGEMLSRFLADDTDASFPVRNMAFPTQNMARQVVSHTGPLAMLSGTRPYEGSRGNARSFVPVEQNHFETLGKSMFNPVPQGAPRPAPPPFREETPSESSIEMVTPISRYGTATPRAAPDHTGVEEVTRPNTNADNMLAQRISFSGSQYPSHIPSIPNHPPGSSRQQGGFYKRQMINGTNLSATGNDPSKQGLRARAIKHSATSVHTRPSHVSSVESEADRAMQMEHRPSIPSSGRVQGIIAKGQAENRTKTRAVSHTQQEPLPTGPTIREVQEQLRRERFASASINDHLRGAPTAQMTSGPSMPVPDLALHSGAGFTSNVPESADKDEIYSRSEMSFVSDTPESIRQRQQKNAQMARDISQTQMRRLSDITSARDNNYKDQVASYTKNELRLNQYQSARTKTATRKRHRLVEDLRSHRSTSESPSHLVSRTRESSPQTNHNHNIQELNHNGPAEEHHRKSPATQFTKAPVGEQPAAAMPFSDEEVAAYVITDIDRRILEYRKKGFELHHILTCINKLWPEECDLASIKARCRMLEAKAVAKQVTEAPQRSQIVPPTSSSDTMNVSPKASKATPISDYDASVEPAQHQPALKSAENSRREGALGDEHEKQDAESTVRMLMQHNTSKTVAEELEVERKRLIEVERLKKEKEDAARQAQNIAIEEKKAQRKRDNDERLAKAGALRQSAKAGKATATGFAFGKDTDDVPRSKLKKMPAGQTSQPANESDHEVSKPRPHHAKALTKRNKTKAASPVQLNSRGYATTAGKMVLDLKGFKDWARHDDGEDLGYEEHQPEEQPTSQEILGDDLTYHKYIVKRKSWAEGSEPDDDEADLVMECDSFTSRKKANAAASSEIYRWAGGDEIAIDVREKFSIHVDKKKYGLANLRLDVPNGYVRVWVDRVVCSAFHGPVPQLDQGDFFDGHLFVARVQTTTVSSGDGTDHGTTGVEDLGEVYSDLGVANESAMLCLVDRTFHSKATRIDDVNVEKTQARYEWADSMDRLKARGEMFCEEKQNSKGQIIKVWVEETPLRGARN